MSAVIPDPALTDWVPLWNLGAPSGLVMIEEKVLGADAASIDFQNIPQVYKSLLLVGMVKGAAGSGGALGLRMNNNSSSIYRWGSIYMTGSVAPGANGVGSDTKIVVSPGGIAGGLHMLDCSIPNYRETVLAKKFAHNRFWNESLYGGAAGGEWQSSAAINQLTLLMDSGNLAAGSRVTLYALTDVGNPPAAGKLPGTILSRTFRTTTLDLVAAGTEAGALTIIASNPVTVDGATEVEIAGDIPALFSHGGLGILTLWEDAVDLGRVGLHQSFPGDPVYDAPSFRVYRTPAAGTHTYYWKGWNTGQVLCGAGGTAAGYMPGVLTVKVA